MSSSSFFFMGSGGKQIKWWTIEECKGDLSFVVQGNIFFNLKYVNFVFLWGFKNVKRPKEVHQTSLFFL